MITVILILLIASVLLGAIADGLNERGATEWGHPVEAAEKVTLLLSGVLSGTWLVVIAYVAFRIALFDIIKNLAKGQHWLYLGDSNWWDKILKRQHPGGVTFGRVIVLIFAIGFTIKEI